MLDQHDGAHSNQQLQSFSNEDGDRNDSVAPAEPPFPSAASASNISFESEASSLARNEVVSDEGNPNTSPRLYTFLVGGTFIKCEWDKLQETVKSFYRPVKAEDLPAFFQPIQAPLSEEALARYAQNEERLAAKVRERIRARREAKGLPAK